MLVVGIDLYTGGEYGVDGGWKTSRKVIMLFVGGEDGFCQDGRGLGD